MIIIIIIFICLSLSKFTANSWWNLMEEWVKLPDEELDKLLSLLEKEYGREYIKLLKDRIEKLLDFGRKWWY